MSANRRSFNVGSGPIDRPYGPQGETYLMWCAQENDVEGVIEALEKGANLHKVCGAHQSSTLIFAIRRGYDDVLKALIAHDPYAVRNAATPAILCATSIQTLDILLAAGAGVDDGAASGLTLLMSAIDHNNVPLAKYLLGRGASATTPTAMKEAPLHIAARMGNAEMIELLLQHGAAESLHQKSNGSQFTPLHHAVNCGHLDATDVLLRAGSFVNTLDSESHTPLHTATVHNNIDLTELLVRVGGADINKVEHPCKYTALHTAIIKKNARMVRELVRLGADPYQKDSDERSPLHIAAWNGSLACVKALIEEVGEEPDLCKAQDIRINALYDAMFYGHDQVVNYLIDAKTPINLPNSHGDYALIAAVQKSSIDVFDKLLKSGANPDVQNRQGHSALWISASRGFTALVSALLEAGANPDIDGGFGRPLHIAVDHDHVSVIKTLLDAGADPFAKNEFGHTPRGLAIIRKNERLEEVFREAEKNYGYKKPSPASKPKP